MQAKKSVVSMVLTALFAAVLAVCAVIAVPLPFTAVPISLWTLGLFTVGGLLRPRVAATASLLHLLLGVVGLPVFSGMRGGLGVLLGPTGGYLMTGPLVVLVIAWITTRTADRRGAAVFRALAMIAGLAVCDLGGTAWYCVQTGATMAQGLAACVVPFLPVDGCKLAAALLLTQALRPALAKLEARAR